MRRLVRPARARRRGQSLLEFGLMLPVWVTMVVSLLSFIPAFTVRGQVLDAAETMTERAERYLYYSGMSPAAARTELCNQMLAVASVTLSARTSQTAYAGSTADASGNVTSGCDASLTPNPGAGRNPVVDVEPINGPGGVNLPAASTPLVAGQWFRSCIAYEWQPTGGLLFLATSGSQQNTITSTVRAIFTFRYCGEGQVYAHRSS